MAALRAVVAEKLLEGLRKCGSQQARDLDNLAHTFQWGLRVLNEPRSGRDTLRVQLGYKYLESQGLPGPRSWCDDVIKAVARDDVIRDVECTQGGMEASVAAEWFAQDVLSSVYTQKANYGMDSILHQYQAGSGGLEKVKQKQRVLVEFSSPNIAKPFHAGHLRSTVLGNSLSRLYRALGHDVTTINYLGDWGTQFGYLGVGFSKYGSEDKLDESPMAHLFDVYVKAHGEATGNQNFHKEAMEFFARMEAGDEKALEFWRKCRDMSIDEYKKTYQRLGVEFDYYDGESNYRTLSRDLVQRMDEQGLLKTKGDTGVKYLDISDIEDNEKRPKFVNVLKSDGTSLYITRDIAAFVDRKEQYKFDRLLYVVDVGQTQHFHQLLLACRKLGMLSAGERHPVSDYHVTFGRVEGMSTRRGQVVFLTHILEEATARMKDIMLSKETTKVTEAGLVEETAEALAVSALVLQNLSERRNKGYKFSWQRVLAFKGHTGPFLQYQHARLCSLLRTMEGEFGVVPSPDVDYGLLVGDIDALRVITLLAKFDEAVMKTYAVLEPYIIAHYLFDLCHVSSKAFSVLSVKHSPPDVARARLLLFDCVRQTLSNGLGILGITPLEKM